MTFLPGTLLPERPSCGWCGLRIAVTEVHATPTCKECADGGRSARVKASMERWKRGRDAR